VFPDGITGTGHYRRAAPARRPRRLRVARYRPEGRDDDLETPLIDDAAGLIWYANRAAIEMHIWLSRQPHLDRPDWAVFDLDPGAGVPFTAGLDAALRLRRELDRRGLTAFVKLSGATGMHVFVPIEPRYAFADVRAWARGIAETLAAAAPDRIGSTGGETHERPVVTIAYGQNSIARNTAAPYTVRARPGATVSAPVSWDEVERGDMRPAQFTLRTMAARLERVGDLWASSREHPQQMG
jgi:bifunctional non-homologous end joining protein LigD